MVRATGATRREVQVSVRVMARYSRVGVSSRLREKYRSAVRFPVEKRRKDETLKRQGYNFANIRGLPGVPRRRQARQRRPRRKSRTAEYRVPSPVSDHILTKSS